MHEEPAAAYERTAADLIGEDGVRAGKLFGMPSLLVGRKAFAGYRDQAMVFKLAENDRREALALPGTALFEPAGMGRPMKEWVQVPAEHADRWSDFGRRALRYVAG
jgi:hypothetical protein